MAHFGEEGVRYMTCKKCKKKKWGIKFIWDDDFICDDCKKKEEKK